MDPAEIVVRHPEFDFADLPEDWLGGARLATCFGNAGHVFIPLGEEFFIETVKQPEHVDLKKWAKRTRKVHEALAEPTDYAFTALFYQLLQFPLWADHLGESATGGVVDSRPARNLAILSQILFAGDPISHVVTLSVQLKDAAAVRAACQRLNLP